MKIYHLVPLKEVEINRVNDDIISPTLATEGFCHCCFYPQIIEIANMFFDHGGVMVFEIETELLKSKLMIEKDSKTSKEFPHVFGSINKESILRSFQLEYNQEKGYFLPIV
jgi:uncharacterized protein (DUF952 family)